MYEIGIGVDSEKEFNFVINNENMLDMDNQLYLLLKVENFQFCSECSKQTAIFQNTKAPVLRTIVTHRFYVGILAMPLSLFSTVVNSSHL